MPIVKTIEIAEVARRLPAWLSQRFGASGCEVSNVAAPGGSGMSASTIAFDACWRDDRGAPREERLILRLTPPDDQRLFMRYDLAREQRILDWLATQRIPVATIRAVETSPAVLGSAFMVMDRVEGRVPRDDPPYTVSGWVLDLPPAQRAQLCDNGLKMLVALHGVDVSQLDPASTFALSDLADPLGAHIDYWERCYRWCGNGAPNPIVDAAFQWVHAHRPAPGSEPLALCWGDARIGNMIFDDALGIAAMLDWEMAFVGSPEVDLGWWLFLLRFHSTGFGVSLPEGCPSLDETVARYAELSGRPVLHRAFYEIFAGLRQAVLSVRAAQLMIGAGHLPVESDMALNNPVTQILAALLGLPVPEAQARFRLAEQAG